MENLKREIQSAVTIFKSGNLTKAKKICNKLILSNPNVAFLYNLLGLIYAAQKKFEKAVKYYEKGIKIDPKFAMIYSNLGLIYFSKKSSANISKAENLYKKSIHLDGNNAEPHNNLGTLYNSISKYKSAEVCFNKAISINSNFLFAYYNLGTLLITMGNFSEAEKNLKKSISLNSNFVTAHRALSRIIKYSVNDEHLLQLENLNKSSNIQKMEDKVDLYFSLGKAYEDTKNYSDSFYFYEKANSIYRKYVKYSETQESKFFMKIKQTFNDKIFKKFHSSGSNDTSPIFIVGMPRSGTTLVEQILSSHSKVFGADEVETIPYLISKYFENKNFPFDGIDNFNKKYFKIIGDEYISKMKDFANNSERITDKLPVNFLSIGFIKLILPKAKIIHCSRNSRDNIFSIFKNNFTSNRVTYAYNLKEIVGYYNLYYDIMNYWNFLLPDFIYKIEYESLISDTEKQTRDLLKFCDLNWTNACLEFYKNKRPIKTASDVQVRNKIYNTSVRSWKKYEKYLTNYFLKLKN